MTREALIKEIAEKLYANNCVLKRKLEDDAVLKFKYDVLGEYGSIKQELNNNPTSVNAKVNLQNIDSYIRDISKWIEENEK